MKRACVIGWPIEHSRSPLIHGYWLKKYGINGSYDKQAVRPEEFEQFVRGLEARGYAGANVTVPHKEAAFRVADELDDAARAAGAVNTLWLDSGRIYGTNTDTYGFLANLDERAPGWDSASGCAAVLGAGGAARGVVKGLIDRGYGEIRLANRTRARAGDIAARFGSRVRVFDWRQRSVMLTGCTLLVNTSTLGMQGAPPLEINLGALAPHAIVNDIVYVPLETSLLAQARKLGHRPVDGLGMLLHQAVPGFERWFGVRPEVTAELRALIMAALKTG